MKKYLKLLQNCSVFAGMNGEEIFSVLNCLEAAPKSFMRDEYILHSGDTTDEMGLMLSGSALIIQEDIWGNRSIMAKIIPGETFAEMFAASREAKLNVSVTAETDCEILMLNINKVFSVCPSSCSQHHHIIRNLISAMAQKTLKLNDKITHMSRRTTRDKLLSYLSSESQRQGKLDFRIPFDRQQLADYLCVDRSAMSAELSKLQKQGVFRYEKNHFVICSPVE